MVRTVLFSGLLLVTACAPKQARPGGGPGSAMRCGCRMPAPAEAAEPPEGAAAPEGAPAAMPEATGRISSPELLVHEHGVLMADLQPLLQAPEPMGQAARDLAAVLVPHLTEEERVALPPLSLLRPLAEGANPAELREVLPMTDSLKQELPRFLQAHAKIREAATRLQTAARAAGNREAEAYAEHLLHHARMEEEVLYPAAILVGEVVRAQEAPREEARAPRR
jgi:hypothetical protein